jgi:glycosyltransferase involved in cell wall biosynthesis
MTAPMPHADHTDATRQTANAMKKAIKANGAQLRVLQVHNFYQQLGGEDVIVQHEATLLRAAGVDLHTWYVHSRDLAQPLSMLSKAKLALRQFWSFSSARELRRRLAAQPVDLIHVHNTFPLLSPALFYVARQQGVPLVLTVHNFRWCHPAACIRQLSDVQHSLWRYVGQKLYRNSRLLTLLQLAAIALHRGLGSYQRCSLLICPSDFVRRALKSAGFAGEQLWLKPHSTALQPLATVPQADAAAPYALFVGRADSAKGLGFLLAAWSNQNAELVVAGVSAAEAEQLYGQALPSNVRCVGFVAPAALAALYRQARLLIVPSLVAETFGNVVIEAFSQGTPCLVSDAGALPELVLAGHNSCLSGESGHCGDSAPAGAVFRAGDPEDFRQQLQQLWQNPAGLSAMRAAARQRYDLRYHADINQQALLACYQHMLQGAKVHQRAQEQGRE